MGCGTSAVVPVYTDQPTAPDTKKQPYGDSSCDSGGGVDPGGKNGLVTHSTGQGHQHWPMVQQDEQEGEEESPARRDRDAVSVNNNVQTSVGEGCEGGTAGLRTGGNAGAQSGRMSGTADEREGTNPSQGHSPVAVSSSKENSRRKQSGGGGGGVEGDGVSGIMASATQQQQQQLDEPNSSSRDGKRGDLRSLKSSDNETGSGEHENIGVGLYPKIGGKLDRYVDSLVETILSDVDGGHHDFNGHLVDSDTTVPDARVGLSALPQGDMPGSTEPPLAERNIVVTSCIDSPQKKEKRVKEAQKKVKKKESKSSVTSTSGLGLEDFPTAVENKFIPQFVYKCVSYIEQEGLKTEGLYRIPGNKAQGELFVNNFTANPNVDISTLEIPVNAIATLLKSFFSDLNEALIPSSLRDELMEAAEMTDKSSRLLMLRGVIKKLHTQNLEVLKYIITHLHVVAEHHEYNSMNSRNLAKCWWPTLIRLEFKTYERLVQVSQIPEDIVHTLIEQCSFFFHGGNEV